MVHPGEVRLGLAAQHRELDRAAVEEFGIPPLLLMENASRACAEVAERLLAEEERLERFVVLVGPGNNGGDGFAIARTLLQRGREVAVIEVGARSAFERASEEARCMAELFLRCGGRTERFEEPRRLVERLTSGVLLVDALFGTGLRRTVVGEFAQALEVACDSGQPALAVDLPSGLEADTGTRLGPVIPARATVTFGAWKPGLRTAEGSRLAGTVTVAEIGLPRALVESLPRIDSGAPPG